jgi:hypothetical protein
MDAATDHARWRRGGSPRDKTRPSRIPPLPVATVDRVMALCASASKQDSRPQRYQGLDFPM